MLTLASGASAADVEAGADEIRTLGFEPRVAPIGTGAAPYVAGPAAWRAAQLQEALRDPGIAGIIATRGGYGSAQVLPWLDVADVRRAGKLLVGYSDLTALLEVWTGLAGVVSVHGPMVDGRLARGAAGYDRDSFLRAVCAPVPLGLVPAPGCTVLRPGRAAGALRGGTLTQLAALAGTPWAFHADAPTVLFLDDVNERPYRLDRMLWQLQESGAMTHVTGVVFNGLPGCDEPGGAVTALDAIGYALARFPGPIVAGVGSGHGAGPMLTLPLGVACTLEADADVRLTIDAAAVQ